MEKHGDAVVTKAANSDDDTTTTLEEGTTTRTVVELTCARVCFLKGAIATKANGDDRAAITVCAFYTDGEDDELVESEDNVENGELLEVAIEETLENNEGEILDLIEENMEEQPTKTRKSYPPKRSPRYTRKLGDPTKKLPASTAVVTSTSLSPGRLDKKNVDALGAADVFDKPLISDEVKAIENLNTCKESENANGTRHVTISEEPMHNHNETSKEVGNSDTTNLKGRKTSGSF